MSKKTAIWFVALAVMGWVAEGFPAVSVDLSMLPACSGVPPYFCADAAYFLDRDSYVFEVYLVVCNEGLQFVRAEDGYRALADAAVVITDKKGKQVTGDTYRVRLRASRYEETTALDSCETRVVSLRAGPGELELAITVRDSDSGTIGKVVVPVEIPVLEDFPTLSAIGFLTASAGQADTRWPGFEPNVRRTYDAFAGDIPFFYEVYHGADRDSAVVSHEILDGAGSTLYRSSQTSVGTGSSAHLERLPVDSLSNGRYTLRVAIVGPDGKPAVSRSRDFQIKSEAFYFGKDVDEAASILAYIAPSSLIDAFVEASAEERRKMWEHFWREKDPTPRTPKNEFYEEHLRRFRYANEHFSVSLSEGWRTDRGRIYILYGEPDEIESYPMEVSRNAMEIWYYYERNSRFVFVDETGFGDYVLIRQQ